jgi:hypothetical protein
METLSGILASFDIFKVLFDAFPQVFNPLVQAFRLIFTLVTDIALEQFKTHPGLISGTVIFLIAYAAWHGVSFLRKKALRARSL